MPKWDKTRNYYADLELPPSASSDEIKKQFKKLALKYHPDRNPGREAEVNPKFQVIQSAHEILVDETLKRQYDEARRSYATRYPGASGVRGNPWQDAAKAYPPPPRRQQNTQARPASGAQRYEGFGSTMPRHARPQTPSDDPQFRRSNAEAWDHIRPRPTRKNTQTRPTTPGRAPPGRAPTSATRDSRPGPVPFPQRTAYQQQKAEAAFGTSKKTGFTPRSPSVADEPSVTNKNYFTNRTHSNLFTVPDTTPEASSHDTSASATVDPFAPFRDQFMDNRQRTPYHTPGGEKTSLFDSSPGLGRSTSTRTPPRAFNMPGAFPRARPRSSSPARSSSNDGGSEDSVNANIGANGTANRNSSATQPKASERHKSNMPTATDTPLHPTTSHTSTSSSTAAQTNGSGPSVGGNGEMENSKSHHPSPKFTTNNEKIDANSNRASSFNFPDGYNAASPGARYKGFARNSTENINTRFVDDEMLDEWQFKAGSASANEATTPSKQRPQSRNIHPIRRQTPLSKPALPTRMTQAQEAQDETNTSKQGFSAGAWSEQIGPQHFEPQPMNSAATSPTRRANVKSKSFKMTAGTAAVVDEEDSEGWQDVHRPSPGSIPITPDAMDIDTPPVEKTEEIHEPAKVNSARKYSTEPHREDWRAGNVNGVGSKAAGLTSNTNGTKENLSEINGTHPTVGATNHRPFQHTGSEDIEEFRTTFSDFKNVEPFADPSPSGLKSFADLQSTLPFESRPSEQIPLEIKPPPRPLEFPTSPVAPRLPPTMGVAGLRPNTSSFRKYAQDFSIYMDKWEAFNNRVLAHFETRQKQFKERRSNRGANWLEDCAPAYLTEVNQDLEVQKKYADACAEHQKRVAEFMEFRDRVR
ncbi:hypothetical protein F4825DRAFT_232432 [Nemania diffusa]|nr:hypothetical protein F4825DRAFT_232432 [Nemania diffusa]